MYNLPMFQLDSLVILSSPQRIFVVSIFSFISNAHHIFTVYSITSKKISQKERRMTNWFFFFRNLILTRITNQIAPWEEAKSLICQRYLKWPERWLRYLSVRRSVNHPLGQPREMLPWHSRIISWVAKAMVQVGYTPQFGLNASYTTKGHRPKVV